MSPVESMRRHHFDLRAKILEAMLPIADQFKRETGLEIETVSVIVRDLPPPMNGVVWMDVMNVEVATKWGGRLR